MYNVRKPWFLYGLIFLSLLLFTLPLYADGPEKINYQGKLLDGENPVDGDAAAAVGYKLFTVSTGGTSIWEQVPANADFTDGLFSDVLDFSTGSIDWNQTLYLEVWVGPAGTYGDFTGASALTPREELMASPHAFSIADGAVGDAKINWSAPGSTPGAGEVSGADVPLEDAGDIYTTDNVEAALQELPDNFVQLGPSTAQSYTGTNALINLSEDGGSTPALMKLKTSAGDSFFVDNEGQLYLTGNDIYGTGGGGSSNLYIHSEHGFRMHLHSDGGSGGVFAVTNEGGDLKYQVTAGGSFTADGSGTITGDFTLLGDSRNIDFDAGAGNITSPTGVDIILDDDDDAASSFASYFYIKHDDPATDLFRVDEYGDVDISRMMNLAPQASAPTGAGLGDLYVNNDGKLYFYSGGWQQVALGAGAGGSQWGSGGSYIYNLNASTEDDYVKVYSNGNVEVCDGSFSVATAGGGGGESGDNDVEVGTSYDIYFPFYTPSDTVETHMLYLQSDIGFSGTATITEIGFNIHTLGNPPSFTLSNLKVKLGHTTETTLSDFIGSGLDTVYESASYALPGATDWFTIDIDDFEYNGSDNLVVAIEYGINSSTASTPYLLYGEDLGSNKCYYGLDYEGSWVTGNDKRPNVRLAYTMEGGSSTQLTLADGYAEFPAIAAPDAPSSDFGRVYIKDDDKLYFKNDGGTEYDLTSGGSMNLDDLGDVNAPSPSSGQVIKWSGTEWACASDEGSNQNLSSVLNEGNSAGAYDINMNGQAILDIDWASSDDGIGSLLDADFLDGYSSEDFLTTLNYQDLSVGTGTDATSIIQLAESDNDITLQEGANIQISEDVPSNTITIAADPNDVDVPLTTVADFNYIGAGTVHSGLDELDDQLYTHITNDTDTDETNEIQDIFYRISDGTNTYDAASATDIIEFTPASGAATVAVNPTTGVITVNATDDQNAGEVGCTDVFDHSAGTEVQTVLAD
ncbi:hypothetical protein JXI42_13720, partial [bacterium]|nr:hypothetical protein [bacterium]